MKTTIEEREDGLVAIFEGRLDTAAAVQTEQDVQPLKESSAKNITLDCTALGYISSSGLRIFLSVLKSVKAKGGNVYITGMNETLRNVFEMTGFNNLFLFK